MSRRATIQGYAVSVLPDGRVKIEGQAPMSKEDADAFLATYQGRPQPDEGMQRVQRAIDYARRLNKLIEGRR